jgi:hypothetical protein
MLELGNYVRQHRRGSRVAVAGRGNDRDHDSCKRKCAANELPAGAFDRALMMADDA